ncbi:hypothetical protein [Salinibacterium sp. GXW1014]|uniref:hypothetical protein n=1 Tax=Salinibacterium sp. GXW1014 TaxID=3377838 RepID=UPI003839FA07
MKLRVALAGIPLLAFALVGCADAGSEPEPVDTTQSPSASPQQSASPTPSTEPAGPEPLSCNTIITQQTLDGFEAAGYVHEVDFESQLRSESRIETLFFDYGGLACFWYLPNSDGWFTAAYSEITETQATEAQALLEAEGYVRTESGTDVTYAVDPEANLLGHQDTYLFEPGAWYHSNHAEGVSEIRTVVGTRR